MSRFSGVPSITDATSPIASIGMNGIMGVTLTFSNPCCFRQS